MVERRPIVIVGNKRSELPIGDTLPNGGSVGGLPYFDEILQTNEISTTQTSFQNFMTWNPLIIPVTGEYQVFFSFQWRHVDHEYQHRVIVKLDGVELMKMRTYQYQAGEHETDTRNQTIIEDLISFVTGDTPQFTFEYATESEGESSYLFDRRAWLVRRS